MSRVKPTRRPSAPANAFKALSLREQVVRLGKPERVDREKGVLYRVKVLGLESANGRRYTPEAVAKARTLYEGLGVYTNHPDKPDSPRKVEDRFGWFENVDISGDGGLIGDFHLLDPGCDLAVKLFKAAEEKPDLFGFSHNAAGDGIRENDGTFVIQEITEVRSVDLVCEPATTYGLFEHREGKPVAKKISVRKFLETIALPRATKAKSPQLKPLKKLCEDEDKKVLDEQDMDYEEDDAPGDSDWKAALQQAVTGLTSSDDPKAHDLASKILRMLKPEVKEQDEDTEEEDEETTEEEDTEEEEDAEEQDESDTEEGCDPKKMKEGKGRRGRRPGPAVRELQEQLTALKTQLQDEKDKAAAKTWLAEECKKRSLTLGAKITETIISIKDKKEMAARLDEIKAALAGSTRQAPRSQGPMPFTEATLPKDGKTFSEALRAHSR